MPTYKVFIRRPTTSAPIWDWKETIVRKDQQTAITDSYQNWVDSKPSVAPPALAVCTTKADLVQ